MINASEEINQTLFVAWHELYLVKKFLLFPSRHHGQFVDVISEAQINECLKKNGRLGSY